MLIKLLNGCKWWVSWIYQVLFLAVGAEILGGGTESCSCTAEVSGRGFAAAGAGIGGERNSHSGARAQCHHSPAVPRETSSSKPSRKVPAQSTQIAWWEPHQPAFRLVFNSIKWRSLTNSTTHVKHTRFNSHLISLDSPLVKNFFD